MVTEMDRGAKTQRQADHIERVIAAACGLASSRQGPRGVRVVLNRRPTYDEIVRYRERAAARGVDLAVDGRGVVTIRPRAETRPVRSPVTEKRSGSWRDRLRAWWVDGWGGRPALAPARVRGGKGR